MKTKLKDLHNIRKTFGLKINCEKSKSQKINVECNKNIQTRGVNVQEVEMFAYLGKEIPRYGVTEIYVKTRIQGANSAFIQLYKILEI
jgi:hypothetical protein